MSKPQSAMNFINESLSAKRTVYIRAQGPYTKTIAISPKTVDKWAKSGKELFKFAKNGDLLMANGKHYNCIVSNLISYVSIQSA